MEPQALATVEELGDRLPFVMDDDEKREAIGALETLSDDARFHGKDRWATPERTPRPVINLVLKAAGRHMKNYDGYVKSRAGDEDLGWTDRGEDAGSAYFTDREVKILRQMSGNQRNGFHSVGLSAWSGRAAGTVEPQIIRDPGWPAPAYVPGTAGP